MVKPYHEPFVIHDPGRGHFDGYSQLVVSYLGASADISEMRCGHTSAFVIVKGLHLRAQGTSNSSRKGVPNKPSERQMRLSGKKMHLRRPKALTARCLAQVPGWFIVRGDLCLSQITPLIAFAESYW